jgi:hypothetical protein
LDRSRSWPPTAEDNCSRHGFECQPAYGDQEGTAYNGHFACTCYHPLFVFNQFGDLERCVLRSGNVHSADGWKDVLEPVVARYRGKFKRRYFRADAAFANPEVYEFLESEGFNYAIRLPANRILQVRIAYLLKRPVGRPPNEVRRYYANFSYQAQSWKIPRRVVAKVEWHPGELYPRVGFIVTNLSRPAERVVVFYNQRGTAEQWIKEGKNAVKWTRLSCCSFTANAVRLQLHALAYNLTNFMRTLALPEAVKQWSLTSLREKLIKIGAKIVRHGRYVIFQMAEVAVPKELFQEILRLIEGLRLRPAREHRTACQWVPGVPAVCYRLRRSRVHLGNVRFNQLDRGWRDCRGHTWLIHRLRPLSVAARHQLASACAQLLRVLWVAADPYRPCSHRQLAVPRRSLSALQGADRHRQSSRRIHIRFDRSLADVLVDRGALRLNTAPGISGRFNGSRGEIRV